MAQGGDRSAMQRQLTARAESQLGLITRMQMLRLGFDESTVTRREGRGELVRIARGVYRISGAPDTWEQRALAAWLSAPGAVLSHRTAARLWAMDGRWDCEVIEMTDDTNGSRCRRSATVRVHRSRDLPARDRVRLGCFRLTSPWRTLVDLAGILEPAALARVADDVMARGLVKPWRLASLMGTGLRGRPGAALLRQAVSPWLRHERARSAAELAAIRMLEQRGLPRPVAGLEVYEGGRKLAELDLAWPEHLLVLEVDGHAFHSDRDSFKADRRRANKLGRLGWTVLRTTFEEILESPDDLCAAIALRLSVRPPA